MTDRALALLVALAACGPSNPASVSPPRPAVASPQRTAPPPDDIASLQRDGNRLYGEKRYADAARALARAVELGDTNVDTAYNAACSFALAGQLEPAFAHLDLAITAGFGDLDHAKADSDLDALHADRRWAKALERIASERAAALAKDVAEEARLAELAAHATLPTLTKEQMYADFDALVKTVSEVSPQTRVRKAVTGIDPLDELAAMRPQIESIQSIEQFALLIRSAIVVFQDGHTSLLGEGLYSTVAYKKLGISDQAIALAGKYGKLYEDRDDRKKLTLAIKYIAGEYYLLADLRYRGKLVPKGSRITHANHEPIHAFVGKLYRHLPMMRWDFERSRYVSERFYTADRFSPDDKLALTFAPRTGKPVTLDLALRDDLPGTPTRPSTKRVEWFDDLGVLYIRMPEMDVDDTSWYPRAIKDAAKGHQVRKVIFDIRNNGGGGDGVWTSALAAVIPRPIEYTTTVAFNPSPAMVERFQLTQAPVLRPDFLPGAEFRTDGGRQQIRPDADSIKFAGRIYVLQNENIFSSAGAFAAVAVMADNIVNVGARTGRLLGIGINPLIFELPHSKLLYRVEPVIDFTAAKSAADLYHDTVELPVPLSVEAAVERFAYAGDLFAKPFLTGTDPVFQKALADTAP